MANEAKLNEIIEERGKVYGDPNLSFRVAGKAMTALLESHYQMHLPHDIPPHVMSEIMVVIKACRACVPFDFHEDNYNDQVNYVKLARNADERNPDYE